MDKIEVARRQLGAALDMFLRGQDPVSVHVLAVAGGEVAEWIAEQAGGEPFKNHVLETFPQMDLKDIRDLQRKYSNAFKHATTNKGKDREDEATLAAFEPTINEHMLFIGWYDYAMGSLPRPIEAQVFEAWYLAKNPEKLNPDEVTPETFERLFPNFRPLSPERKFARLGDTIRKARKNGAVMQSDGTDRRPLVLPWPGAGA
jgi:hypothetical protein